MTEPFATVAQFLGRFEARFAAQLTSDSGDAVDNNKVLGALADATGELEGYLDRIPATRRPNPDTLRVHCIKVATALLAGGRPGKEFDSIRNNYTDTISFYKDLLLELSTANATPSLGVSSDAPPEVFTSGAMAGFVPRG